MLRLALLLLLSSLLAHYSTGSGTSIFFGCASTLLVEF